MDRSLNNLALTITGKGFYWFGDEDIYDVVREYLSGEPVAYQQDISEKVRNSPFLTPIGNSTFSFWHPVFQDYFAAQGLRDATLKDGSVEQVLRYFGDSRFHNSILHLVQIVSPAEAAKIIDFARDHDPFLAANCVLHIQTPSEELVQAVFDDLLQGISEQTTVLKELSDEIGIGFLFDSMVGELLLTLLPGRGYHVDFKAFERLGRGDIQSGVFWSNVGNTLKKIMDYIAMVLKLAIEFEFNVSKRLLPTMLTLIHNPHRLERIVGFYWVEKTIGVPNFSLSQDFLENLISASIIKHADLAESSIIRYDPEIILRMRVNLQLIPVLKPEDNLLGYWEELLKTPRDHPYYELVQTYATLGLAISQQNDNWWMVLEKQGYRDHWSELMGNLRRHELAQIRFVAIDALGQYYFFDPNMLADPNPLVRHIAASHVINEVPFCSGDEFRLAIENLILPLQGKMSPEIREEFIEFEYLDHNIHYWTEPLSDWRQYIGAILLIMAAEDEGQESTCIRPRLLALVWAIGIYRKDEPDWTRYANEFAKIKQLVRQIKNKECILTEEDIIYIKTWTDHDLTREIAEEVIQGKCELPFGEI